MSNTRSTNPMETLGDVTVFCVIDNRGVLSENEPSADHILMMDEHDKSVRPFALFDLIGCSRSGCSVSVSV